MRILFVDRNTPRPYTLGTVDTAGLGGTEATVARVAARLAAAGHRVVVAQHNRTVREVQDGVEYVGSLPEFDPTHVVLLRRPDEAAGMHELFPSAAHYCWMHSHVQMMSPEYARAAARSVLAAGSTFVCVSDWHREHLLGGLLAAGVTDELPVVRIYNPVDDGLGPDATVVDRAKLVFFSSPHKGLAHTLKVFRTFSECPELADMRLYVANPGYYPDAPTVGSPGVVNLGALSHGAVLGHVRSALAVFHLNREFPETFGLVHAECNAVGTPFLSHPLAANFETRAHADELIDVEDTAAVRHRILRWRRGPRITVRGNPAFRLSTVAGEWIRLFERTGNP